MRHPVSAGTRRAGILTNEGGIPQNALHRIQIYHMIGVHSRDLNRMSVKNIADISRFERKSILHRVVERIFNHLFSRTKTKLLCFIIMNKHLAPAYLNVLDFLINRIIVFHIFDARFFRPLMLRSIDKYSKLLHVVGIYQYILHNISFLHVRMCVLVQYLI